MFYSLFGKNLPQKGVPLPYGYILMYSVLQETQEHRASHKSHRNKIRSDGMQGWLDLCFPLRFHPLFILVPIGASQELQLGTA